MSRLITINDTTLKQIGNKIRQRNKKDTLYKPHEMAEAINDFGEGACINIDGKENKEAIGFLGNEYKNSPYEKLDIANPLITKLRKRAFFQAYCVNSINFPFLTETGPYAFCYCPEIQYSLPRLKIVNEAAFWHATLPEGFYLPELHTIEMGGFKAATLPEEMYFDSLYLIGEEAFAQASGVKKLHFRGIENIGKYAFYNMPDLESIHLSFPEDYYSDRVKSYLSDSKAQIIYDDYWYME